MYLLFFKKKLNKFIFFITLLITIKLFGKYGNNFAFNVDNFFIPIFESNFNRIINNFLLADHFSGFNFAKVFQIAPNFLNLLFAYLDYKINGEQTVAIFLRFYFINYACFYLLIKKYHFSLKKNFLYSFSLSTSTVLTCSISMGFGNIAYIIAFFPFILGWCLNKLDNKYCLLYFLICLSNFGLFIISVFFALVFSNNLKKIKSLILIILLPISVVLIFVFINLFIYTNTENAISFAMDKNYHGIFLSNRPLQTFFNLGFMDRSYQMVVFNEYVIILTLSYSYFYLKVFKLSKVNFKIKLALLLFILNILYMVVGNIFPHFLNYLFKNIPGLIAFRGQYLFNIFGLFIFFYLILNTKNFLEKDFLILVLFIFQITTMALLFFDRYHLENRIKNIQYTRYDYYNVLKENIDLRNNNIFFPILITNNVLEADFNIRNGSGFNYHLSKYNPLLVKELYSEEEIEKLVNQLNIKNIVIVKKDINLKTKKINSAQIKKNFENENYIIYENLKFQNKNQCDLNFKYYKCLKKFFKLHNFKRVHESANFNVMNNYLIYIFHLYSLVIIIITIFIIINIFIIKNEN